MKRLDCPLEPDVLSAVYTNRWPDRADAQLRAHVAECAICSDVVIVAAVIDADNDAARAEAHVPDSGLVWWRAQMRARAEAARTAVRPITVAQAVGLAVAVGVAGAIFGATTTWFQQGLRGLGRALRSVFSVRMPEVPQSVVTLVNDHSLLLTIAAAFVLLAPLVMYYAVRRQERET